jgi:hypothetical protein
VKRGCGWLGLPVRQTGPPVWVRKHLTLQTCPRSYISGDSLTLVEEFLVRRKLGGLNPEFLNARQVEAFLVLESALASEQ